MKKFLLALTMLLLAFAVFAVPLTASWIEGKVERGSGSAWKIVSIGDTVDSSMSVRLAAGALAEFTLGSRRIALSAPGVYSLDALVKAGSEQTKKRSATMGKLGKLVDPKAAETATAVAGVRGAAQGEDETMWMTEAEGPEALAEEARSFARESRFADAAALFGQAAGLSSGEEKAGYAYARAWSLAAGGSNIEAIKALRAIAPATAGAWAGQRALLLARLDIDSGAFAEARDILTSTIAAGKLKGEDLELANGMLEETKAAK
jgi:hypothetical protein